MVNGIISLNRSSRTKIHTASLMVATDSEAVCSNAAQQLQQSSSTLS